MYMYGALQFTGILSGVSLTLHPMFPGFDSRPSGVYPNQDKVLNIMHIVLVILVNLCSDMGMNKDICISCTVCSMYNTSIRYIDNENGTELFTTYFKYYFYSSQSWT